MIKFPSLTSIKLKNILKFNRIKMAKPAAQRMSLASEVDYIQVPALDGVGMVLMIPIARVNSRKHEYGWLSTREVLEFQLARRA